MNKSFAVLSILLLCAGALAYQNVGDDRAQIISTEKSTPSGETITISPQRRVHILYGDKTGGGHFHTANKPCKSEFPEDWSADKIIQTISKIAANDNAEWTQERNGYYMTEQKAGALKIRVILDEARQSVITAYPVNVPRNPCPANDNRH